MKKATPEKTLVTLQRPLKDVLEAKFDALIFARKLSTTDVLLEILSSLQRIELHLRGPKTMVTEVMDEATAATLGITPAIKKKPLTSQQIRDRRSRSRSEH